MVLLQQPNDGSHLESIFLPGIFEVAMWDTPSLDKAEILQDTRSCVFPRSSDENNDAESSRRAQKNLFYVHVVNLGILGTTRLNVDEDLRMAVQTLQGRLIVRRRNNQPNRDVTCMAGKHNSIQHFQKIDLFTFFIFAFFIFDFFIFCIY